MIENIKITFFFFYDDYRIILLVPQPSLIFVACFILPYSKKIFVMINRPCIKWLLNFIFISNKKMLIYCFQYSAGEAVHERTPNVTSQCFNLISSEMGILNYAVSGLKSTYVQ